MSNICIVYILNDKVISPHDQKTFMILVQGETLSGMHYAIGFFLKNENLDISITVSISHRHIRGLLLSLQIVSEHQF